MSMCCLPTRRRASRRARAYTQPRPPSRDRRCASSMNTNAAVLELIWPHSMSIAPRCSAVASPTAASRRSSGWSTKSCANRRITRPVGCSGSWTMVPRIAAPNALPDSRENSRDWFPFPVLCMPVGLIFHRARRPDNSELTGLLDTLSRRIVRVLERRGLLIADPVDPYLDLEPGSSWDQIQAASIAYRIAIGPHAGRKARDAGHIHGRLTRFSRRPENRAGAGCRYLSCADAVAVTGTAAGRGQQLGLLHECTAVIEPRRDCHVVSIQGQTAARRDAHTTGSRQSIPRACQWPAPDPGP